jgi:hypothetical protein
MDQSMIVERLGKLEKSNRRLKAMVALCAAGLLAAGVIGADRVVQPLTASEQIRLLDQDGRVRMALGCDKEGTFLFLNDETGRMRASIAAQSRQVYLNLKDGEGTTRLVLVCDGSGPSVKVKDARGGTVATLTSDDEGGLMQLVDDTGRARVLGTMSDVISEPKLEEK